MLETYTINDDIKQSKTGSQRSRGAFAEHRITDIRAAAHSERVNIFVDDKFFCSLDISQVVDQKVKIGRVLDEEAQLQLKRASDFGKFYALALEYALLRPRSAKEISDYLERKTRDRLVRVKNRKTGEYQTKTKQGYDKSLVAPVLKRLTERGYVDDRRFAELWVENRHLAKGTSQKKLRMELLQKGISQKTIDEVLANSGRDEKSELQKIIAKKRHKYPDEQKLIQYLLRQGFNYSDISDELSSDVWSS